MSCTEQDNSHLAGKVTPKEINDQCLPKELDLRSSESSSGTLSLKLFCILILFLLEMTLGVQSLKVVAFEHF